jgi:ABC-type uncharacterized transport system YnjBCD ATPase subunit
MRPSHCAHLSIGALLVGALACNTTPTDQGQLRSRRLEELDALSRQAGMPDHYLKDAKAMEAAARVDPQPSPPLAR